MKGTAQFAIKILCLAGLVACGDPAESTSVATSGMPTSLQPAEASDDVTEAGGATGSELSPDGGGEVMAEMDTLQAPMPDPNTATPLLPGPTMGNAESPSMGGRDDNMNPDSMNDEIASGLPEALGLDPYYGISAMEMVLAEGDAADVYFPNPPDPSRINEVAFPAIVLLQGGNVSRQNYAKWAEAVAVHGFVVIVPDRRRTVALIEGLFADVGVLTAAFEGLADENLRVDSPLEGVIDLNRTGVMGHSLGGAAGLEAIGSECSLNLCTSGQFERPQSLMAGVFYGTNRRPLLLGDIPPTDNGGVAVLMMQGTVDGSASPADGRETYDQLSSAPKAYLEITGANHYSITDTQTPQGAMPDFQQATLNQGTGLRTLGRYTALYFVAHIFGRPTAQDLFAMDTTLEDGFELTVEGGPQSDGNPSRAGRCTVETIDANTGSVPLKVYAPSGEGEHPIVVFNPGLNFNAEAYESTLRHLASWCYVVVANGKVYTPITVNDETWTADITRTVEWVRTSPAALGPSADVDVIALLGHSGGAKNSFRALAADDTLASTLIALDVSGRNPPLDSVQNITAPVLLLGETYNREGGLLGMNCAPAEQNFETYFGALTQSTTLMSINFANADHLSWIDDRNCGLNCLACPENPADRHAEVLRQTRRYTTAWLETVLRGSEMLEGFLNGDDLQADIEAGGITVERQDP